MHTFCNQLFQPVIVVHKIALCTEFIDWLMTPFFLTKIQIQQCDSYASFVPEMSKTWSRSMAFFRSRDTFFVRLLKMEWSRSLELNFKIEIKNDASANCEFDSTTLVVQSF